MRDRWLSPGRLGVFAAAAMGLAVVLGPLGVSFWWFQVGVGALLLASWWRRPADFTLAIDERLWRVFLAAALGWLGAVAFTRFWAFEVDGVAFGALEQAVDSTHRGRFGASSMLGGSLFAVAPALVLLPIVLLHEAWPTPLWLIAAGPLVVWLGLFPVRRLVRLANGGPHGAFELAACLGWLGNGLTGRALADGFSLELLIPLIFAWLVVAWVERDAERVAALAVLLLVTKDEAAVLLVGFVVAGTLVERWRWSQALFVTGLAVGWSLFTGLLLRPRLLGPSQAGPWDAWTAGTVWQAFGLLWREPVVALERVVTSGWWLALLPMLALPLRSVRAAGSLLPLVVLLGLGGGSDVRAWQTPLAAVVVGVLLFGVLDVWAVWRSAPGLRWREGLVLAALVGFGLVPRWPLRVHGFDGERHAHLKAALASLEAAPMVCVQPVLVPHLGSSRRLVPFLKASCVDRPGAVALLHPKLAPSPWRQSDLEQLQARRPSEVLPGGFVVVRALPK